MTTNTHMHLRVLRSGGRACKRPQFNMKLNNSRKILLNIWPQVLCMLWICCKYVAGRNLSQHDISLLEEEDDPKCFTRTEEDFTCFFQTTDNGTFDLFYKIGQSEEKRCELLTQRTKEGMLLHICSFPYLDVVSYVDIHLQVVERNNNNNNTNTTTTTRLYSRMVSVEDHILLDAPFNVALLHNGKPGQLQLSCLTNVPKYWEDKLRYRIRYTSKRLGQRTKEVLGMDDSVMSLVPGEEVRVEIAVKCGNIESAGHWSRWSQPVRDVVPQSADDISLKCHTSDLQMISCQWNGSTYSQANGCKLFTKMHLSETLGWTDWTQCVPDKKLTEQCTFQGEEWKKVRVKVSTAAFPLSRTFYTQEFTLRNIIQTEPPAHLTGLLEKDKLCLKWEAPLMTTLSSHLQYEVGCQIRESKAWVVISPKGPATGTCLEVPPRIQYRVKVRAKPNGSIYSGQWSQWSHVVSGKTPADIETLLLTCIPATLLVTAVLLFSLGFTYARKLKQWFWPPVPNLDKVLQGFVKEINLQKWDPPVTAKQYFEEGTASIVEVMSQDGLSGSGQESTQLLSPSQGRRAGDREEGNPRTELKLFPDYVTLNRECVTICSSTNKYVCKQQPGEIRGPGVEGELLPKTSHSFCVPHNNFLNHSYLPLSDPALEVQDKDTGLRPPENVYTNLPCS